MKLTLLNTRPAHQAEDLNSLLLEAGATPLNCPTLSIQFIADSVSQLLQTHPLFRPEIVILTSRNAVEGLVRQIKAQNQADLFKDSRFYAIGKATQQSGLEAGLNIESLSTKQFDSENLLAHEVMKSVESFNVLIVKGVGGRDLLAKTLNNRGANVHTLDVYERLETKFCDQVWETFIHSQKPVLLVTSLASWEAILKGLKQHYAGQVGAISDKALIEQPFWSKLDAILVMSQRIVDKIRQQGWEGTLKVVETQSNQGIMNTLSKNNK